MMPDQVQETERINVKLATRKRLNFQTMVLHPMRCEPVRGGGVLIEFGHLQAQRPADFVSQGRSGKIASAHLVDSSSHTTHTLQISAEHLQQRV